MTHRTRTSRQGYRVCQGQHLSTVSCVPLSLLQRNIERIVDGRFLFVNTTPRKQMPYEDPTGFGDGGLVPCSLKENCLSPQLLRMCSSNPCSLTHPPPPRIRLVLHRSLTINYPTPPPIPKALRGPHKAWSKDMHCCTCTYCL